MTADNIDFAGYKMPHPLQENSISYYFYIKLIMKVEDTIAIFKDSIIKVL